MIPPGSVLNCFCSKPGQWGLHTLHHTTCLDEGVVVHKQGNEGLTGQVCKTATQKIELSGDEASLFSVQGAKN